MVGHGADGLVTLRLARGAARRCAARAVIALVVTILAILATPSRALAQSPSREYQIKAVFLFNFVEFVEWPASAFSGPSAPIVIGVLGVDPFGSALDEAVEGETIHGRRILVRRSQRVGDLRGCQLLFISRSEKRHLPEILTELNSSAVLTVSEMDGFIPHGGVINFYLEGNKVRFEINPGSAQRRGLKLSSQLLSLGKVFSGEAAK